MSLTKPFPLSVIDQDTGRRKRRIWAWYGNTDMRRRSYIRLRDAEASKPLKVARTFIDPEKP